MEAYSKARGFLFSYILITFKSSKKKSLISLFNSQKRKKSYKDVSLVLSGGGARGFGHIGVIEVLLEKGFHIHSVTGTSMGALVGGIFAMGKLREFKDWITQMGKLQALDLIDISIPRRGFLKGNRVFRKMKKLFPSQNIEELNIGFSAVATQLYAKKTVCLDSGDIYDAIRASVAIPAILSPVEIENDVYVDGGILNNIPIEYAKRKRRDLLVVVDVNAFTAYEGEHHKTRHLSSNISVFTQSLSLLIETNAKNSLKAFPPDILIPLSRDACEMFDFFKVKSQIEYGRKCAEKAIEEFLSHEKKVKK